MSTAIAVDRVNAARAACRATDTVRSPFIACRPFWWVAALAVGLATTPLSHAQSAPVVVGQPIAQSQAAILGFATGSSVAYHTVALRADGTMWAWGFDRYGQLGDGLSTDSANRCVPLPVPGITGITSVSAGAGHTLAVTSAGTVYAWGFNAYGQLGDGGTTNRSIPNQVPALSNVTAVAAGAGQSLALKGDGTVWGWGSNQYGELGDGTTTNRTSPIQVPGLSGITAVSCGLYHNLALKSDGTVWAWGYNNFGQLGDGTATTRTAAFQISGLSGVVAIACGCNHNLVLKSDGTVWAWGSNNYGQLGDGTTTDRATPVRITAISNVLTIAGGNYFSAVLKNDHTVWCWGHNLWGELGNNGSNSLVPVQAINLTSVNVLATGMGHCVALKSDGTVWTWGNNWYGALGNGGFSNYSWPDPAIFLNDCVFSVAATGSPAPQYQWYRKPAGASSFQPVIEDGTYISASTANLHVRGATTAMNGDQFRCVVTNSAGSVTSDAAVLGIGAPALSILGGNNQSAYAGTFNAQPFDLAVWTATGTLPLMSTPVTFTVQNGGGALATTNTGSPTVYSSITLNTDSLGTAQVYYLQPTTAGVTSQIVASSGGSQVVFTTQSLTPPPAPNSPAWARTSSTRPNQIVLSWGAASPAVGGSPLAGYNVYRNGVKLNGSPLLGLSYTDTNVTAGASYGYVVKAVDTLGKESAPLTLNITAPASSTAGTFEVFTPAP